MAISVGAACHSIAEDGEQSPEHHVPRDDLQHGQDLGRRSFREHISIAERGEGYDAEVERRQKSRMRSVINANQGVEPGE